MIADCRDILDFFRRLREDLLRQSLLLSSLMRLRLVEELTRIWLMSFCSWLRRKYSQQRLRTWLSHSKDQKNTPLLEQNNATSFYDIFSRFTKGSQEQKHWLKREAKNSHHFTLNFLPFSSTKSKNKRVWKSIWGRFFSKMHSSSSLWINWFLGWSS